MLEPCGECRPRKHIEQLGEQDSLDRKLSKYAFRVIGMVRTFTPLMAAAVRFRRLRQNQCILNAKMADDDIEAEIPADAPESGTARRLRGFGPLGTGSILLILASSAAGFFVSAVLILAWARLSGTPLSRLGFKAPRNWTAVFAAAAALGIALKLILKAVVMPLLGAPAVNMTYHDLVGNAGALPGILATVVISAAFGEEVFFRGWIFERLDALWGCRRRVRVVAVLLSAALFAAAHFPDQGLPGVEQATMTGLVFGAAYAWRKQIVFVMVAHAAYDLAAVAIIYGNWEQAVARWVFQ